MIRYILAFVFFIANSILFIAIIGFILLGSHGKLNLQNSQNLLFFLMAVCFLFTLIIHFTKYKLAIFKMPSIIFYFLSILSASYLMVVFVRQNLSSNFLLIFFLQVILVAMNIYYLLTSFISYNQKPSKHSF